MNIRQGFGRFVKRLFNSGVSTPAQWFVEWAQAGAPTASGETSNSSTALGLTAYLACIKNISEDIAKMPLGIYRGIEPRGSELMRNHPVTRLLMYEPNEEMSAMTFRETLTSHALGWHGGFAEIVRDQGGIIRGLYPLDPTCVMRRRDNAPNSSLYYLVHGMRFEARDIFDIHGLGYDGVTGYVLSQLAKDPIANAIAAQKFCGAFFGNGTVTTGVIEVPDAMSETAFKHLRESFHERHGGGKNAHKPIILEEGAKWTATTNNAEQSQMIETLQHGIEEVCRLFRMPPHKIQHLLRSTFSNIESQALEYVVDALLGWGVRWEQEIYRKLLSPREKANLFAKHNFNMLLRGDMTARSAFYREMFNIGTMSVNDIRDKEDLNPVDGGDAYFVNAALVPLEMAATGEHLQQNEPQPAIEPPKEEPKPASDMQNGAKRRELIGQVAAAHVPILERALAGILKEEHGKVSKASSKAGFTAWSREFYQNTYPKQVIDRLSPAVAALTTSITAVVDGVHENG